MMMMLMMMSYTKHGCYFGRRPLSSVISNTTFYEVEFCVIGYGNETKKGTYSKGTKLSYKYLDGILCLLYEVLSLIYVHVLVSLLYLIPVFKSMVYLTFRHRASSI